MNWRSFIGFLTLRAFGSTKKTSHPMAKTSHRLQSPYASQGHQFVLLICSFWSLAMSAIPPKADIRQQTFDVRFVP